MVIDNTSKVENDPLREQRIAMFAPRTWSETRVPQRLPERPDEIRRALLAP